MPQICTICTHPERAAIEQAMVGDQPNRAIARQWRVSKDAVARHKEEHLPARVVKAQEATDLRQALDVVAQLKTINRVTLSILKGAHETRNDKIALAAVDRVQRQIELQARLLGELDDRPVVNILILPEWQQVRAVILAALADEPSARVKVAAALRTIDVS
jgi:hypothetical protein